jgi:bacterial/archaeal transporter family-2 protein
MSDLVLRIALSLLAASAGASLVVQVALNAKLRDGLASWSWAGLISYLGGTLTMVAVVLLQRPGWPSAAARAALPWSAWIGGFFGAIYIVLAISLLPRLGAASLVALVVAGQMLASTLFDHYGLLGMAQRAATPGRLLGAALIVAGVVLIRR